MHGGIPPLSCVLVACVLFFTFTDACQCPFYVIFSTLQPILKRIRKIAKLDYYLRRLSVCQQGTSRLPLNGLSWNYIFDYFSKICQEHSRFILNPHK